MPLIDMPLEQLREYGGRNPRPADHDEYWRRALDGLAAVDARVELTPAAFTAPYAECFDLHFTGVGGARVHARYLRPKRRAGRAPALVKFHGYSGAAGPWCETLCYVAMGYHVAFMDARGQGGTSEDVGGVTGTTLRGHIVRGLADAEAGRPDRLLLRHIFLDAAQLAAILMAMPDVDPGRVAAAGGSQGGGLALACAALEPRVARCAATFPFLCDYRRVWEMDLAKDAYAELKDYFRRHDPRHEREERIFEALGYVDVQHLAPRVRGEVLMFTGLSDSVCPPSTQFAAYNRIVAPKRMVIYPDCLPDAEDFIFSFLADLA